MIDLRRQWLRFPDKTLQELIDLAFYEAYELCSLR